MKNCEEMVNSLLERREQYLAEQKRKRKVMTSTAASIYCVCLVALLGFGMWQDKSHQRFWIIRQILKIKTMLNPIS